MKGADLKFQQAIVRRPGPSFVDGLTTANLGTPDYDIALRQHDAYIAALERCGLSVTVLEADNDFPDSVFIEDAALVTDRCGIITRPGAESRRGETDAVRDALARFRDNIDSIEPPGTVDAGDIMMVGEHFYIGLSSRTNGEGARQMIAHLEKYGFAGSPVPLQAGLHLKSSLAYLEDGNLVATSVFRNHAEFKKYNIIPVDDDEEYAANCVWVNGSVLVARGFPGTRRAVEDHGYDIIELDVSEFRKLDGGLSCLSLRF
jgi:dimethylargininase